MVSGGYCDVILGVFCFYFVVWFVGLEFGGLLNYHTYIVRFYLGPLGLVFFFFSFARNWRMVVLLLVQVFSM
ncbi:hypothetical protein HOY82DRAFT_546312 [Tuber indicum]|nr:hypothetical protein HOY82DRAFT_546312 [Tuber indicum]